MKLKWDVDISQKPVYRYGGLLFIDHNILQKHFKLAGITMRNF